MRLAVRLCLGAFKKIRMYYIIIIFLSPHFPSQPSHNPIQPHPLALCLMPPTIRATYAAAALLWLACYYVSVANTSDSSALAQPASKRRQNNMLNFSLLELRSLNLHKIKSLLPRASLFPPRLLFSLAEANTKPHEGRRAAGENKQSVLVTQ